MSTFLPDTVDVLRRTPGVISALLTGLPDAWTGTPDVTDGWRPRDVVGHLISAEIDNWIPRAERICEDGTSKPFDAFNRSGHIERDVEVPLDHLVEQFAGLRAASMARLDDLVTHEADLDRRGVHPALGEVTLRELLATWASTTSTMSRRSSREWPARTTPLWAHGRRSSGSCSGGTIHRRFPAERAEGHAS